MLSDLAAGIVLTLLAVQATALLVLLAWAGWLWSKLSGWRKVSAERNPGQPTYFHASIEEKWTHDASKSSESPEPSLDQAT